jgi:hypothetical protein
MKKVDIEIDTFYKIRDNSNFNISRVFLIAIIQFSL